MIKGDKGVEYGRVVEVMGVVHEIGVPLALAVEPLPARRR